MSERMPDLAQELYESITKLYSRGHPDPHPDDEKRLDEALARYEREVERESTDSDTCPTCGSRDPTNRLAVADSGGRSVSCFDPWHSEQQTEEEDAA
jgi:hypothetical protein